MKQRKRSQEQNDKLAVVQSEMKLSILSTINSFKSKIHPKVKITNLDVIHVLSSIIARNTE